MEKIYQQAKDKNVSAVKIYKKAADEYAYADSDKTVKIAAADLKDMFEKGCVVIDGDVEYKPISFGIEDTVGTLTYVMTDGTTATTAVLETVSSSEYTVGG